MATLFFKDIFENDTATRVMAGIIALSIFGNIVVLTFTASRGDYHKILVLVLILTSGGHVK